MTGGATHALYLAASAVICGLWCHVTQSSGDVSGPLTGSRGYFRYAERSALYVHMMEVDGSEICSDGAEDAVVQTTTTRDDAELAFRVYKMLDGNEAFSNMSEFHVTPMQGEDGAIVGVQVTGIQRGDGSESDALHTQLFDIQELGDSPQLESEPPNPEDPCGDVMEEQTQETNAPEDASAEPQEPAESEPPATEPPAFTQDTDTEVTMYSCAECKFSSTNLAALRRHLQRHTDKYKCKLCEKQFACSTELRIHMNVHLGIKPHKCSQCDMAYTTAADLVRHTRSVHSLEKPFQCCYCDYTSAEASRMKIHIRSHTGERPFSCTQCPFASTDAFKLRRHIQTHTGEKPYSCNICQAKFTQRNSMKMHILRKHTENLPKEHCPICNAALFGKHDVQVHIRKQHGYLDTPIKCRFCTETFHERYIYRQHQQSHRLEKQGGNKPARAKKSDAANTDGQDAESGPKENSLTWNILPSSEETQLLLNLHGSEPAGALTELHSIPMQAEDGSIVQALVVQSAEQVEAAELQAQVYELQELGEVLQPLMEQHSASGPIVIAVNCNQSVLADPEQAVNPNDASQETAALPSPQIRKPRRLQLINPEDQIEVKLHRCKECDKSFSTGLELLRHKRSHKGENSFKCPFCEYETPEAEQLILHIQIHSEDRAFHCEECNYATTDAFKLSRHKRTHTGERPYSCSVCQISFTQKSTMEMHVLRKHTKELPKLQCPMCDTVLTGKVGLKIHIRKQHSQTENALKCRFCPDIFHERFLLRQHLKVHQKGKVVKRKAVMRNNNKPTELDPGLQEEAFTWQIVPAEQETEVHLLISEAEEMETLSEYHVLPLQTEDGSIIGIQLAGLQGVEQLDMDAMHTQVILGDGV